MFESVGDDRLPGLDPCIVTRFDDVGLARADVPFGTVAVHDVELTADDRPCAGSGTGVCALDVVWLSTVKHHLANARSKVGATTTAQLVWILAPRLSEPDAMALDGRDERRAEERDQSRSG